MTDFNGPSSLDSIVWKDTYGKLLAIWPYGREEVVTKFGTKPAVRADVYDLDQQQPLAMDALIFPRALVMQTSSVEPGKCVVGRLGQGEPRSGQQPPWKLADPTPEDLGRAQAYFAQHPPRIKKVLSQQTPPTPVTTQTPVMPPQQNQQNQPEQPAQYPITSGYSSPPPGTPPPPY